MKIVIWSGYERN